MKDLIEFYTRVVTSLGYEVTEDGYITFQADGATQMLSVNNKTLVLPTSNHIGNTTSINDDGEIVVDKVLFNPLSENVVKGYSPSFKKIKDTIEYRVGWSIFCAGYLLLLLTEEKKQQENLPMYISKFLMKLSKSKSKTTVKLVDDKTIKLWEKLFTQTVEGTVDFIKLYIKKQGTHNGVKYNRLATAKFPVYDSVIEYTKGEQVLGLDLRPKDANIFVNIFEYLIPALEEDNKVVNGSDDDESPVFVAAFGLYLDIVKTSTRVLKALKHIHTEMYDVGYSPILVTKDELLKLGHYKGSVITIPDGNETTQTVNTNVPVNNKAVTHPSILDKATPQVNTTQQQITTPAQPVDEERELANMLLYGNNNNSMPVMLDNTNPNNMVLPQYALSAPTQAVPAGINSTQVNSRMIMPQQNTGMQGYPMQNNMQGYPNNNMQGYPLQNNMQGYPVQNNMQGYPPQNTSVLGYPNNNMYQQVTPQGANGGYYNR